MNQQIKTDSGFWGRVAARQQTKINELKKQLAEAVEHIESGLETHDGSPCRLDHNGNCQEHGWFGLEDGNCPTKLARQFLAKHKERVK